MNEKQMLDFSRIFKGATLQEKLKNTPAVSLLLIDGSEYEEKGRLETVNGLVNPSTGTTQFRAEFPNPQSILRSGGTGVVRLPIETKNAIVIPQNAVTDTQGKQMIYVVGKDNKVKSRIITTSTTSGLNFIVSGGLEPGEVIVVEGVSKLKDDTEIVPQQAKKAAAETASANTSAANKTTTAAQQKK
jgi:membrane fusion protein (multidrug efflux system)